MSVGVRLKEFLDSNHLQYQVLAHRQAFTAQEVAAAAHVPGKDLAKSVVLKVEDRFILAVLPAPCKIDFERLRQIFGTDQVRLAHEHEFSTLFPGCEIGAMPPFGNLYGVSVYVDESITKEEHIVFNAGTHTEAIQMNYADFERVTKPIVTGFAMPKEMIH